MNLIKFTIKENESIMSALKKIELNKKGFLIIIDINKKVLGTLTDGDLRRAFIKGADINDNISNIYSKNYKYLSIHDSFSKVVEIFKSKKIEFLPIVNENLLLTNIITKKNMHVLLMEDIEFEIEYDFLSLDDSMLEHEIYNRPWGFYKTTFLNLYSQSKIIKVKPLGELSLQEHKKREEHWVIIQGDGEVVLGESVIKASPGNHIFIPKGCKHKLINRSETRTLMVAEVQLGEYFGEDDIIRYQDVYGRI
jgi:mannose-1-phosphate guanylyltransferase/mannose-6-phosphate isomerase